MSKTEGEVLFEHYLNGMKYSFEFEKQFQGKSKKPDYTIATQDGDCLFDVKDFDPYLPTGRGGAFDPYPRIREKIDQGRKKFKEFKEFPCSVVLRNNGNVLVDNENTDIVLGAMYGDSGFSFPIDVKKGGMAGPMERAFLARGRMIRRDNQKITNSVQNTTISALITLRRVGVGMRRMRRIFDEHPGLTIDESVALAESKYTDFDLGEKQLGVIVWENAVARIPLPRELFTGPYDERWGVEDDCQRIVFRGDKLADLCGDK